MTVVLERLDRPGPQGSARPAAPYLHPDGHWVITFSAGDTVWELEIPGHATSGLPVRIHLVESGSRRGIEASARVSWADYYETVNLLSRADLSSAFRAEMAMRKLLEAGFHPLAGALH